LTSETIASEVQDMSEELLKRDIAIDSSLVHYDDGLLLGSLINIEDSQGTRRVLSNLSYELTLMHFSQFHQGYEVVGILQSLRQK
jgi:hypothetical protein